MEIFDGRNEKIRLIIFSLSFLWFIFGMTCMLVGGHTHGYIGRHEKDFYLTKLNLANFAIALIPVGSFIVIISFFGCCAAIKGSRRMTITNLSVLCIVAFIKFILGCVLFDQFTETQIEKKVELSLTEVLNATLLANVTDRYRKEFPGEHIIFSEEVHDIHFKFQCCGVYGSDFYHVNDIPHSCCNMTGNETLTRYERCDVNNTIDEGCFHIIPIEELVETKTKLGKFFITMALFEFGISIFEMCITKNIKEI